MPLLVLHNNQLKPQRNVVRDENKNAAPIPITACGFVPAIYIIPVRTHVRHIFRFTLTLTSLSGLYNLLCQEETTLCFLDDYRWCILVNINTLHYHLHYKESP
jgi:hypothetical protein